MQIIYFSYIFSNAVFPGNMLAANAMSQMEKLHTDTRCVFITPLIAQNLNVAIKNWQWKQRKLEIKLSNMAKRL